MTLINNYVFLSVSQMLRLTIFSLLAFGVFSLPSKINPLRDSEWAFFKKTYNKAYEPFEELTR